jgi:endo-1,4-beta-xylanase
MAVTGRGGWIIRSVALASLVACAAQSRTRHSIAHAHWTATWATSQQIVEPANMPPAPGLSGNTLRQIVHVSLGGARIRVRFSNVFGDGPLTIGSAAIAPSLGESRVAAAAQRDLTFGGHASVVIAAGRDTVSDELPFDLPPLSNVAVTTRFGSVPATVTGHPGSRTTSYIQAGDALAEASLPNAVATVHWYVLTGIDVGAPNDAAVVVALGNSITDGRGSGTDRQNRWPDELARRLQAEAETRQVAVINAGIGGNCVLRSCLGPSALARLDRDVLQPAAARWVIVLEGVNDIGQTKSPADADSVARGLIAAYAQIVERAHTKGIVAYGATILPFGGSFYDAPYREAARETVNRWMRTSRAFDAVIDLDAALRDPAQPSRLVPVADGGDHLHPNETGYRMMAAAIDPALFRAAHPGLKDAFRDAFMIGAALSPRQFDGRDTASVALVLRQFNATTPENVLKWERVHPEPDRYQFAPADAYVEFGERNGMFVIGHTLVWHNQTPRWVFENAAGQPLSRDELLARMKDHISTVVGRYKGRIKGWDVVNEALNDDGTLRQSPWMRLIGPDYIAKAFQFAHEADPAAQLYYNDYNLDFPAKRDGVIRLVRTLQAAGVPIHAVGSQEHLKLDTPSIALVDSSIRMIAATGVKVNVTELDIDVLPAATRNATADVSVQAAPAPEIDPYKAGLPDSIQQALARRYEDLFRVYLAHRDAIDRVTFWGVADRDSWLNGWPVRGRTSYPLLFDRQNRPKPAYDRVMALPHGMTSAAPGAERITAAVDRGGRMVGPP